MANDQTLALNDNFENIGTRWHAGEKEDHRDDATRQKVGCWQYRYAQRVSTEIHDALGRLLEVCDGATSSWGGSCNAQRTLYSCDEQDHLIRVCQNAAGSSCGQVRTFGDDGRGFLVHEIHPELGPDGNGTVDYRYDGLGMPKTQQTPTGVRA